VCQRKIGGILLRAACMFGLRNDRPVAARSSQAS
jgi:hypothetical protein